MTCHETTQSLGAYVLGSLDASQRSEVDAHIVACPACAAELSDLDDLPGFLGRLSMQDVADPAVTPAADLFDRVAAAARRGTRRRPLGARRRLGSRRLVALIAAALVVVVAAVGFGVRSTSNGPPTFASSSGQVRMSVTVVGRTSGTDLGVTVDGLPVDEQCQLIAVSRAGLRDTAGSWVATYSGTAQVTGSTTIPRSQLAELILLGTNGEPLVTVPV